MNLDPAHLSLRIGTGPFYHLFVRQFEIDVSEARDTMDNTAEQWVSYLYLFVLASL